MSNPKDYTVGWICAISTEYVAAQAFLDENHDGPEYVSPNDNNDYTLGKVGRHNVVIAVLPDGEYGTTSAAIVARDMLHSFPNIRIGLMVGIGGGAPSPTHDIHLGDIVVSASRDGNGGVFQYDFGKTIQDQRFQTTGFLNQPPSILRTAMNGLKAQYELKGHQLDTAISHVIQQNPKLRKTYKRPDLSNDRLYRSEITHPANDVTSCEIVCGNDLSKLVLRPERSEDDDNPEVYYGLIASANQLMKDATVRDRLVAEMDVLCFEMEAAGLMNRFPCLLIRGICDYSDSHKNKEWQGYAAMTAAAYAKDLLCRIPPNKVEAEKRIGDILSDIDIQERVSKLRVQHDREHETVLNWLTPTDYAAQQSDFLSRRQEGTGQWILNSVEYQMWLNSGRQTLFCPGIPGAGKTILTSIVVEELTTRFSNDPNVGIAYIYCNFRRQNEQKIDNLLASLLKQLAESQPSLPGTLKELYDQHKTERTWPSLQEISAALQSIVTQYSRLFIIVDALDECLSSNGCQQKLLSEIFNLQTKVGANVFVTSRFIPEITDKFAGCTLLEIRASEEDIRRYLEGHMSQLPTFVRRSLDLQEEIKTHIIMAVDGMFLLAQLHLDSLKGKRSPKAVRNALNYLPTGSGAYDYVYTDAMERIEGQLADQELLAKQALSWITCAKRPLTTSELQYALAVEVGEAGLDEENLPQIEDIVSVCAGLITVDKESSIIRLVHYTTQEYFERTQRRWFPSAQTNITATCVTYLLFDEFESGMCRNDDEFEQRLQLNKLYDYAAHNWGYHAQAASTLIPEVIKFLERKAPREASSQALLAVKLIPSHRCYSQRFPRQITGLHLTAYFGVESAVQLVLKTGKVSADSKDSNGRTPLSWAAEHGHGHVVQLLLDTGEVEADSKDTEYGRTPLSWAAEHGHGQVVQLLLNTGEVEADSKDTEYGRTPLSYAAANGHDEVVQLLLNSGQVEPDSVDSHYGQTPLSWAAKNGHDVIVQLLIKAGANIDSTDERGSTALHESIRGDHQAVQELLIELGANLDIKNQDGQTASDLAWSKKRLDWSAYLIDDDLTAKIDQGAQARCEVLRRKDEGEIPLMIFRKNFNMSEAAGKTVRKYLLREHKILQKLNHPFIVSYLGYEENLGQKTAALYMEFCEAGDLHRQHVQRLETDDDSDDSCFGHAENTVALHPVPLREDEVWSMVFQLAAAMAYLHHGLSIKRNGAFSFERHWISVIHRDIKPANVVLKIMKDGRRIAKLCDLGLVKAVVEDVKQTMGIGTRDYSPPEVRSRRGWTLKGDIYSFGVTLDDLVREPAPQTELIELLEKCKAGDQSVRPSSLSILETARNHMPGRERNITVSLHDLLGSGPGGYLFQSLITIASGLDEYAPFSDESSLRRQRTIKRLKLLCEDGAGDLFDIHSESLHLSVLLSRQHKLKQLLVNGQNTDVNKKWQNSGWTPLHLAVQEDKQDMAALLIEYGADSEITDKYMRPPKKYYEEKSP